jgi:hypothetical protein
MTSEPGAADARPGDRVEVNGRPGRAARSGEIVEVLGSPGHERFRVRWDERHESIFFPTDGVVVRHREVAGDAAGEPPAAR